MLASETNVVKAFEGMPIELIKCVLKDKDTQLRERLCNTFTLRVFNKTGDELNELNDDINWNPSMGGGTTENPLIVEVEDLETETTTLGTFSWVVLKVFRSAGGVVRFCCIGLRFFETHFQCAACSSGVTTLTLSSYYVTFVRCVVIHAMQCNLEFAFCITHFGPMVSHVYCSFAALL
jgi:hypothetical protein